MALWFKGGKETSRNHGKRPWNRAYRAAKAGHVWASEHGKGFYAKLAVGLTLGVVVGATGGAGAAWMMLSAAKAPIAAKIGGVVVGAWTGRTIGVVTGGVAAVGPKKSREGAGVVLRGWKSAPAAKPVAETPKPS